MKNKYVRLLVFYLLTLLTVLLLNYISPNAHDSGLGLGGISIILATMVVLALTIINVYKAIVKDKEYYIIALIHFIILSIGISRFFI